MTPPPTLPPVPGGGHPHPNPPRLVLDVTVHDRLVTDTPAHVRRDRWMTSVQLDGVGTWIHHGDADQAEQVADWAHTTPGTPLVVGSLTRLESRLTLEPVDGAAVLVRVAYLIANGAVSTGWLALPRAHIDRWGTWLSGWLTAHPAPLGQLALFAAAAAA